MGIVFVPFAIGVFSLFVDASRKWAWWLTHIGLAIVAVEILSRIRFLIEIKTSHFFMMLILFLFGCAWRCFVIVFASIAEARAFGM